MRQALAAMIVTASGWAGAALGQDHAADCDRLAGLASLPRHEAGAGVYAIRNRDAARTACEAAVASAPDDGWSRVLLARVLLTINPQEPRVALLLTEALGSVPALAHARLAALYEDGLAGVPNDAQTARIYYARGCDTGAARANAPGCAGLGVMLIEGRGGAADLAAGFAHLAGACDLGWGRACVDLALQGELRGDGDPARVAALFEAGCNAGDLLGCSLLGFRHELGEGVNLDLTRARSLYQQACDGGEPQGCSNLGEVYRSGLGVAQDIGQALRLFDIGCDGQDAYACMALGFILADGRGVPADPDAAYLAFEAACVLGDPEGCDMMDVLR